MTSEFFDFCTEMLCVADHRGYFTEVNPAWTKTLGWSREELTSRPYVEFVHPDDIAATAREASLLTSDSYETVHFRNRYRCKDGSYRWFAWKAKNKPNSDDLLAAARDVTDEQLQIEALKQSEERFRSLADYAPIGIAQADVNGHIGYVNEQLCSLVASERSELLGRKWQELVHPRDREALDLAWEASWQARQNLPPLEARIRRSDGDDRWVNFSVALLQDAAGALLGQIVTVVDVHARKTSEQQYRAVFEQAPLGIAVVDSSTGRIRQLNPAYAEILGRGQDDAIRLDLLSVTFPEDLPEKMAGLQRLLEGEIDRLQLEQRYVRPDGSLRWVDLTVLPLWSKGADRKLHMAIAEDISDIKRAEELLLTREAQLAALLDHSPNLVYLKDAEGRYLLVNRHLDETFGRAVGGMLGKTHFELFPAELAQRFHASDAAVWQTGVTQSFEEHVLQGGTLHTFRSVKFPVRDKEGRMLAVGGISMDITDLRRAYEDLAEKENLLENLIEVQEKEKQLICYEFHDGLIQYAVGSAMSLESYQSKLPVARRSPIIDNIIRNLRRGIEEGRRVIRGIRPTVLDDLGLHAALEDLVDQMAAAKVRVELEYDHAIDRLPSKIEATLYRVVQEALTNVRKHSRSERAVVRVKQDDRHILVQVQDFGCGFSPGAVRSHGFGLVGMTERVRLLRGECRIISEPAAGTTINVRLPKVLEADTAKA